MPPTTATPRHHPPHVHAAGLDACLDLINTEELSDGVPEEHLPSAEAGVAWLAERGLAHAPELAAQAAPDPAAWLARLHAARAALRALWDAEVERRPAPPAALDRVNDLLDHGSRTELRPRETGVEVGHRHGRDALAEALATLARPLVDELAAGRTDRFRICANDGCRWVFEDTSRGGRRRWCDMTTCGNRAKARRFRSRRRGQDGQDAGAEGSQGAGG